MKEIVEGWRNVIVTDEKVEALSKERMGICEDCEMNTDFLGVNVCRQCHCPLVAKTRSPESKCPLNKW